MTSKSPPASSFADHDSNVGFIGLGVMGQPMALNLARGGTRLVVWNRTPDRCAPLEAHGAFVAATPAEVFARARVVFVMLVDEGAIDAVLGRGTSSFGAFVEGRVLVVASSITPGYARALAADVEAHGGSYVEAPVSGSRVPAEQGALVGMLAGDEVIVEQIRPLFGLMCRKTVYCGNIGDALLMKLAVNQFLITMVTGLAEAAHFARRQGLDLQRFQAVVDAGPMASSVSRIKIAKIVERDFAVQAAISDVFKSASMIGDEARASGIAAPLIEVCRALFGETMALGATRDDMAAVVRALEARTSASEGGAEPSPSEASGARS
ncbi:NAD(P)-dependent oxidoreductase [Deinococcus yavapaiensis]|uniref:NAD(P)-dependent oxidoreductase n=1 Tax=Deinococcus yavapaiensis TaxID=309889 RepID=UPI001FE96CB3|nr:NAD(P)-dependent oxidoreductase [Deinococcus yavapaiensis]